MPRCSSPTVGAACHAFSCLPVPGDAVPVSPIWPIWPVWLVPVPRSFPIPGLAGET